MQTWTVPPLMPQSVGGFLLFFLQQPHEVGHAGVVFTLGRLRGRLVFATPSLEPFENHVGSID